jgi:hypothetical protein
MRALSGSNMSFVTLPIANEVTGMELNGSAQDVNIINVPYVQHLVQEAFYPVGAGTQSATATPAPSTITVDVYNGSDTSGLAADVSKDLTALGYKAGTVADATAQAQTVDAATQVFYGSGAAVNAASIASQFGATPQALTSLPADRVEVLLGSSATAVPAGLSSPGTAGTQSVAAELIGAQATPSPTPTPSTVTGANDGQTGGSVTVTANAPYGIPCVY